MELLKYLMDLLRPTRKGADWHFAVRSHLLDLQNLFLVCPECLEHEVHPSDETDLDLDSFELLFLLVDHLVLKSVLYILGGGIILTHVACLSCEVHKHVRDLLH